MFFSLPNIVSTAVSQVEAPWDLIKDPAVQLPAAITEKSEYSKWCSSAKTRSAFISGFEGMSKELRVADSEGNVPYLMHALVVDYDSLVTDGDYQALKDAEYSEFLPAYMATTFSGNLRLIWLFEGPVPVTGTLHAKRLIKLLNSKLKLTKWHGGLDTGALGLPSQYYHIGREWTALNPDAKIPRAHLQLWAYEAGLDIQMDVAAKMKYDVPIADLEAKIEDVYPGRWQGEFALGRRGCRFWEEGATNNNAAIVCAEGMLYFAADGGGFKTWRQLFGAAFVEQYEADRMSKILDISAYDGRGFWLKEEDKWRDWDKSDFSQKLRVMGFNATKVRGQASEIDKIEEAIKRQCRVERAAPFVHYPDGILIYDGERYLNICKAKVIQPAPPVTKEHMTWMDGKKHFPFIFNLIKQMFEDDPMEPCAKDEPQIEQLLAWAKHFYTHAYHQKPKPGLTLFLIGAVEKGKTLFSREIMGRLMGGYADGTPHLVQNSEWTDAVANKPIMAVDDCLAASHQHTTNRFSSMLKKYVANASLLYNQKFKNTCRVPWCGRIIVTANDDMESIRILPNMDISTKDKIMLLKCGSKKISFPQDRDEISRLIDQELPFFARFLMDWTPSSAVTLSGRFGLVAYHHPDLINESLRQGNSGIVLELLSSFLPQYQKTNPDTEYWNGTSTMLYNDLAEMSREIVSKITPHALATALGVLMGRGANISRARSKATRWTTEWQISYSLLHINPEEDND